MNRKILYAAVALSLIAAGAAVAQQTAAPVPGAQHEGRMKLDANGDGAIDRSEVGKSERLAARFDEMDKNKDGKLTADERPQWRGRHGGRDGRMMKADTDKDGRISQAEAAADPKLAERFKDMDANKDGYADSADRELRGRQHREEWFSSADTNKDGNLTKAEMDASAQAHHAEFQQKHEARSAERFQKMDKNGDGVVSRVEMQDASQAHR
ncbi:EF-hand domain-containing protein [Luteimonas sp. SX5]|uniref:EF-hand domain-containing protein n=1 Tax=Luteimonas galliterrae TaxID=2940486 RepID=A0ABT0MGW1_9GAMM|nr:EF-hand domain-containing protein [Luteimonas galliterrae]MCL1634107.1 EF-hand domain-containing protein [Luteimonas galliterrae]